MRPSPEILKSVVESGSTKGLFTPSRGKANTIVNNFSQTGHKKSLSTSMPVPKQSSEKALSHHNPALIGD